MEIQDIITLAHADLNRISKANEENIDAMVVKYKQAKDEGFESVADKMLALHSLMTRYEDKECIDGLNEVVDCLEAAELFIDAANVFRLLKPNDTKYYEAAYRLLFMHFDNGNELEKGFSAEQMILLIVNAHKNFHSLLGQIAEKDSQEIMRIILAAFAPYVLHLYKLYPQLETEKIKDLCESMISAFKDDKDYRLSLLPMARYIDKILSIAMHKK